MADACQSANSLLEKQKPGLNKRAFNSYVTPLEGRGQLVLLQAVTENGGGGEYKLYCCVAARGKRLAILYNEED